MIRLSRTAILEPCRNRRNFSSATNNYEAAKARYDTVVAGAKQNAIASARAQVEQARAALEKVMAPATESEIAAAEAQVRQAEADLALRKAGARAETIAAAEADLTQAQTALMQRQLELADTELHAPFTGTVASLNLETGEQVVAGSPVAQLADLTDWRIETDDLTEINVVYVHVGDRFKSRSMHYPIYKWKVRSSGSSRWAKKNKETSPIQLPSNLIQSTRVSGGKCLLP